MTDRIIELAKQAMTEACEHFGEDAPPKAELDLIHDEPETQWYLQRFAELVRNDALDATCQDSRHVPGCVDAGMQAAPMQAQFTDDELDLFRQWYNSVQDTNGGYLVELDHALFRKLRAIKEAPVQEPVYAFRRKGMDDFCTCNKARFDELASKPHLFETAIFYTSQPSKAVKLTNIHKAVIGHDHFGNPIPKEWYAAAEQLESDVLKANGVTE